MKLWINMTHDEEKETLVSVEWIPPISKQIIYMWTLSYITQVNNLKKLLVELRRFLQVQFWILAISVPQRQGKKKKTGVWVRSATESFDSKLMLSSLQSPGGTNAMPQQFPVLASDHAEKYRFEPDCGMSKMLMRGWGEQNQSPELNPADSCCNWLKKVFFIFVVI